MIAQRLDQVILNRFRERSGPLVLEFFKKWWANGRDWWANYLKKGLPEGDKRINVSFGLIENYDTDKNMIGNQLCC